MEIVVTDVTYLKNQICVAGWDEVGRRMIRPLSGTGGAHWTGNLGGSHLFWLGNRVRFTALAARNNRGLPHSHEDVLVADPRLVGAMEGGQLATILAGSESKSVGTLFGQHLQDRKWIPDGSDCPSLGAVSTLAERITFHEQDREKGPQLRCRFVDQTLQSYDFPVSSVHLKDTWKSGGLGAVNGLKAGSKSAHIRIGLASPFPGNQCYAMVNNILFH